MKHKMHPITFEKKHKMAARGMSCFGKTSLNVGVYKRVSLAGIWMRSINYNCQKRFQPSTPPNPIRQQRCYSEGALQDFFDFVDATTAYSSCPQGNQFLDNEERSFLPRLWLRLRRHQSQLWSLGWPVRSEITFPINFLQPKRKRVHIF